MTEDAMDKQNEYTKPVEIPFNRLPDSKLDYRDFRFDRTGRHHVIRMATWNVLNRHDDFLMRFEQSCRFLYHEDVDIATIQEIPFDLCQQARDTAFRSGFTLTTASNVTLSSNDSIVASIVGVLIRREADIVPTTAMAYEPVDEKYDTDIKKRLRDHALAIDAKIGRNGIVATFVSRHGAWGATEQQERLDEAKMVEQWLINRDGKYSNGFHHEPIVLMGGDFNATRNEPSQRYLLDGGAGGGAFWADVQDMRLGANSSYNPNTTFIYGCANDTASAHGIDVEYMPSRRIDYLMTRGWKYGRPGGFTDTVIDPISDWEKLTGERDGIMFVSDHKPIIADVIID